MWSSLGPIVAGMVLLGVGAEALVRGAASIAQRMGMAPILIGLTVIAFGTSAPELVASFQAARVGSGGLAVGNVMGSNVANIALVLGLAALIRPLSISRRITRIDAPLALAVSVLVVLFMANQVLGRLEGVVLFSGIVLYAYWSFRRVERTLPPTTPGATPETESTSDPRPLYFGIPLTLAGVVSLVVGADLFVDGARSLAVAFGVSEAVIGLTIMAVGTSLPEIATTFAASLKGYSDIVTGNAIGSNLFNALCVLGFTATFVPFSTGDITWIDNGVFLGTALLIWIAMLTRHRLSRLEGALLVTGYAVYVVYLY